ncbi:MAG: haloacid dehalogenase type II [Chloroflexi bacterium]|nr:haloacid dehalogenase type II [Chloroflexota bacterium]
MTRSGKGPGAVFFDLYGTLLNLGRLDAECEAIAPGRGAEVAAAWRSEQLRLTWLRTIAGAWADFEVVTADALASTGQRFGLAPALLDQVAGTFDRLPPRAGAEPVLRGLREAGLVLGILSNGSEAMIERALDGSGLRNVFDHVLSVDSVRRYKPDPAVYQLAVDATGLAPASIAFVTANDWDAAGAAAFGFDVAWLQVPGSKLAPRLGGRSPRSVNWADVGHIGSARSDTAPTQG